MREAFVCSADFNPVEFLQILLFRDFSVSKVASSKCKRLQSQNQRQLGMYNPLHGF